MAKKGSKAMAGRIEQASKSSRQVRQSGKNFENASKRRKPPNAPIVTADTEVSQACTRSATGEIDLDRHRLIREAAYRLYAIRGYVDGHDLDDWLQAEAAIDHPLIDLRPPTA